MIYKCNAISIHIPANFFVEIKKRLFKFIWMFEGTRITKTILKNKIKVGGLTLPNFKIYSKATVTKTVWYSVLLVGFQDGVWL